MRTAALRPLLRNVQLQQTFMPAAPANSWIILLATVFLDPGAPAA